jgi:L-aspartate oxidase
VSRAIEAEMKKHGTWCVYLDTTHLDPEHLKRGFPTIYERLSTIGVEMEKDWIPVVPAQHYSCGGVRTDLSGRTSVPGLYASGEVARTGVHGANRLASNSLLEAIVFSIAASEAVAHEPMPAPGKRTVPVEHTIPEAESIRLRRALQREMTANAGITRTFAGLREAQASVEVLLGEYEDAHAAPYSQHGLETRNLLLAARHVIAGALSRGNNVGLHFNVDLAAPGEAPSSVGAARPLEP